MAVFCKKCGAKLGLLSNYGNGEKPLCYDCANEHENTDDIIEKDDAAASKFIKSYETERNTTKKQMPRYINPLCVLALKDAQAIDRKSIRNALKRLQADISLSDNQAVEYNGRNITVSILHDIDAQLSESQSIECHSTIAYTPLLILT